MRVQDSLSVKLYADGADLDGIRQMAQKSWISGFTTNPTLIRKAGVTDYGGFARQVLAIVPDRPVSFEVFADEFGEMEAQAREIASWGPNVFVKVPVTNTKGVFTGPLLEKLSGDGVQLNVTAVFSLDQVRAVVDSLSTDTAAIVSVFAGRIADTGRDPVPLMREAVEILKAKPKAELLWASPRELLNVIQADECGCHIITATNDVLAKLALLGKDLDQFSRETVEMFYEDAAAAGYTIETAASRATQAAE
jgi:transaldolase